MVSENIYKVLSNNINIGVLKLRSIIEKIIFHTHGYHSDAIDCNHTKKQLDRIFLYHHPQACIPMQLSQEIKESLCLFNFKYFFVVSYIRSTFFHNLRYGREFIFLYAQTSFYQIDLQTQPPIQLFQTQKCIQDIIPLLLIKI